MFLLLAGLLSQAAAGAIHLPRQQPVADVEVELKWLGGTSPQYNLGTTFGLPWPKGQYSSNDTHFTISNGEQQASLQSWVTAYWPDNSIKWTGHALPATDSAATAYTVSPVTGDAPVPQGSKLSVVESEDFIEVNTGKIIVKFAKNGHDLISSIQMVEGQATVVEYLDFEGDIESVAVSEDNISRVLVTVRGSHKLVGSGEHEAWLPFVVRFYLYAESEAIKVMHSITFDGNPQTDFVTGIGLRFDVPLKGEELYNRHIRLAGVDGGIFNEAIQGITGLRRDPGQEVRTKQYEGEATPPVSSWDTRVSTRLKWIPAWSDYRLSQLSPDGFTLQKRTKAGQSWVKIPAGTRAGGLAYLGGATQGGLGMGMKDFWKRYPTGLDVNDAATDTGVMTLWLYSPEAPPMDLRPYHDGLVLTPDPSRVLSTQALGTYWDAPNNTTQGSATIEKNLDFLAKFYQDQVEQRRWYGFWDHGDFMHTYDSDRHTWRYDVGGYAWDNSELSPDIFFWLYFLRTGREDVYRFAEALTRHTGEVDVYHIGEWKGLGTRHGVQHWADSAKQGRISTPQYRKIFYYLSGGDERIGELMSEILDMDQTFWTLDARRKVRVDGFLPAPGEPADIGLGTDWSALAAAWLIEIERHGPRMEEADMKLINTMAGIGKLKNGFVTGSGLYNPDDGTLAPPPSDPGNNGVVSVSHLSAMFGLVEVTAELIDHYGDLLPEGFEDAWLDYCYYYGASSQEQASRYGTAFTGLNLYQGHSRLTAYAAKRRGDAALAKRAWDAFYNTDGMTESARWKATVYVGGLAPVATSTHVYDAFIPFGEIVDVQVPKNDKPDAADPHRGFAYVEFEDPDDAKEAIDNMDQADRKAIWEQESWLAEHAIGEDGVAAADENNGDDPMQGLEGLDVAGPKPE
ncbi:unnamed protein product [Parascedosporium putredinis]|uniref:RRM domain-containing protein n=1 Tax=Parascedosporium putredinis TaxID=1442378 RepID=A0A9P1GY61_9PEZI|nr:unnamed protein product [Parascedosporium putredinis]CAI7990463.1 unnamed protein product [Parascedosporium putredinis]